MDDVRFEPRLPATFGKPVMHAKIPVETDNRFVAQLLHSDASLSGQVMGVVSYQRNIVFEEKRGIEFIGIDRPRQESDIGVAGTQGFFTFQIRALGNIQGDILISLLEILEYALVKDTQNPIGANQAQGSDPARYGKELIALVKDVQNLLRPGKECLTLPGHCYSLAGTHKQLAFQFRFQPDNGSAQSLLGNVETLGRLDQTLAFSDLDEKT